jgi:hypothetical protein
VSVVRWAPIAPAELLAIDVTHDRTLTVSLSTTSGAAYERTTLSSAECAALPHFNARWGHGPGRPGRLDVLRGVFGRMVDALGLWPVIIIRLACLRRPDRPAVPRSD